jgi:ATP-dependent DNA helicase RecQ
LQRRLKLDRETLDRAIEKLVAQGVAVTDWNGVRATGEGGWQEGYDAQVAARREQIDRMMAFAEGASCRMNALVEHFGDRSDPMRACGRCDVCQPSSVTGAAMRQADERERGWLRAILAALANRGTSTGKLFTELALTKDRKDFDALLDGLARAGLIAMANDTFRAPDGRDVTYRKVSVTHEGRTPDEGALDTVWLRGTAASKGTRTKRGSSRSFAREEKSERRGHEEKREARGERAPVKERAMAAAVEMKRPVPRTASVVELNGSQAALEERLRMWRKEQAQAAGLPSFFIFSDTVLREIVVAAPGSLAELQGVRGVGPEKLERFGAAVLEICRA